MVTAATPGRQDPATAEERYRSFARLFKNVVREAVQFDRELAARHGLALTDLMCLGLLDESTAPVSPKTIAEHVDLSTGATTALIDRLEREGFIERQPNPADRRGVIVVLVAAKAGAVLDEHKAVRERLRRAFDGLSPQEADGATRFLRALSEGGPPCPARAPRDGA
ncbi:MarR family winged helix-turn-helix transcriptional regulator [Jiella sonneratiae]|uniref:MarR family transcriptional regulator n=1 Tax=Jiella sonneratiae TaxID=2816856 RepID=A0ABS3J0B0_9HYPH|nr:MarR family transcriptional regulator [Jiella sonneratiae]MBO0903107.1 MarR family transcriptional regulator [Jiella sonneratiae]